MLTTIPANVILDPIVALELLTLVATFFYIARVVLSEEAMMPRESFLKIPFFSQTAQHLRLERQLLSFFGVGCLISQPKNSLKQQRAFRRAYVRSY